MDALFSSKLKVNVLAVNLNYDLIWELLEKHGSFTFHIENLSRVALAQLTRHRVNSFSVMSQRYVKAQRAVLPPIRGKDKSGLYHDAMRYGFYSYNLLLKKKEKQENARFVLPMGSATNLVMTVPLAYARHEFNLRLDKHAQAEIRALHVKMLELMLKYLPQIEKEWPEVIEKYQQAKENEPVQNYL